MIQMRDIVKRYTLGGEVINALDHVSMDIKDGEYLSIIGPSGSGKSSIGKQVWGADCVHDLYSGWDKDKPIVDCIGLEHDFKTVTGALASVGLGDVPAWLRPFHVLSNGEQFRAGLARLTVDAPDKAVVDEFTSVIDRQIAQIGAAAFAKAWRRNAGKQIILLSCHYDIIEWLQPDWVYDTRTAEGKKNSSQGQLFNLTSGRSTAVTGSFLSHIII